MGFQFPINCPYSPSNNFFFTSSSPEKTVYNPSPYVVLCCVVAVIKFSILSPFLPSPITEALNQYPLIFTTGFYIAFAGYLFPACVFGCQGAFLSSPIIIQHPSL